MMKNKTIGLIIPCYNEAKRLNIKTFLEYTDRYYFVFVNDGSSDTTPEVIRPYIKEGLELLDLPNNQGKAEAVRQGMKYIQERHYFNDLEWVGLWDADLSTPLNEVENFLAFKDLFAPQSKSIFGSRVSCEGSKIERSPVRHYCGRIFATFINNTLPINTYDSQCGAKLFSTEVLPKVFDEPFVSRWIFDIEIILRLESNNIIEYPLRCWKDVAGSKISVFRDLFKILRDIYLITRWWKNRY